MPMQERPGPPERALSDIHPTQAAILDRTLAVVRRHGRRRRLWGLSTLAAAYLAGGFTVWAVGRAATADSSSSTAAMTVTADHEATVPTVDPLMAKAPPGDAQPAAAYVHPRQLRQRVPEVPLAERCGLLRTAGDRYLLELDDIAGALTCYQQLLELESVVGQSDDSRDTWLLANLRRSDKTSISNSEQIQ